MGMVLIPASLPLSMNVGVGSANILRFLYLIMMRHAVEGDQ